MERKSIGRIAGVFLIVVLSPFLIAFGKKGISSEQGYYLIDVQFLSDPVRVGRNSFTISMSDRELRSPAKQKLSIEAIPWMPAHEHGTGDIAAVKDLGGGKYLIEGINFSMAGDWEVYLKITTDDEKEDTAVFDVPVEK